MPCAYITRNTLDLDLFFQDQLQDHDDPMEKILESHFKNTSAEQDTIFDMDIGAIEVVKLDLENFNVKFNLQDFNQKDHNYILIILFTNILCNANLPAEIRAAVLPQQLGGMHDYYQASSFYNSTSRFIEMMYREIFTDENIFEQTNPQYSEASHFTTPSQESNINLLNHVYNSVAERPGKLQPFGTLFKETRKGAANNKSLKESLSFSQFTRENPSSGQPIKKLFAQHADTLYLNKLQDILYKLEFGYDSKDAYNALFGSCDTDTIESSGSSEDRNSSSRYSEESSNSVSPCSFISIRAEQKRSGIKGNHISPNLNMQSDTPEYSGEESSSVRSTSSYISIEHQANIKVPRSNTPEYSDSLSSTIPSLSLSPSCRFFPKISRGSGSAFTATTDGYSQVMASSEKFS
jgi:hypothetical protein